MENMARAENWVWSCSTEGDLEMTHGSSQLTKTQNISISSAAHVPSCEIYDMCPGCYQIRDKWKKMWGGKIENKTCVI